MISVDQSSIHIHYKPHRTNSWLLQLRHSASNMTSNGFTLELQLPINHCVVDVNERMFTICWRQLYVNSYQFEHQVLHPMLSHRIGLFWECWICITGEVTSQKMEKFMSIFRQHMSLFALIMSIAVPILHKMWCRPVCSP